MAAGSEQAFATMGTKWQKLSKKWLGPALAPGAAAGLTKPGGDFNKAYAQIRTGTGATGKALAGLKTDFKELLKTRPDSLSGVAEAITKVHQRTGLTGKGLQDLSANMLRLSKMTKTDLGSSIESVTRLMGDWSVPAGKVDDKLNELFRAAQHTGVPFDQLATSMTKFGSPMRQLGFSMEQTAALVGKFEKEGVNTNLVMGAMRKSLGKFAKEGKDPVKALQSITDQIKGAGNAGKANAIAVETFGAKAGPDMAAAVREGRFELGDLFKQISD